MKKKWLVGVIIVALVVGVYQLLTVKSYAASPAGAAGQQRAVAVDVVAVAAQDLVLTEELPGRTSAYQVAEIRPQVSGIVVKRMFTEGSLVKKGQQLYQIDDAPYLATFDSAAASLKKAEATLRAAEPTLERYTRLIDLGGVSRQDYDNAVAAVEQAKADVAVARAAVSAAMINLNYTKVLAPISGRIGRSVVTEGALVTANQTTALATIQNLSKVYVDVSQSASELMKLRRQAGSVNAKQLAEAELLLDGEADPYVHKGEVLFSDISVDETTGMVQLRILFPNPDEYLLPGLFVKARLAQSSVSDAIVVPQQSVIRGAGGSSSVWVVGDDDTVSSRPVVVTRALGDKWLVASGLESGERIVLSGVQKIRSGAKVTPNVVTASAQ